MKPENTFLIKGHPNRGGNFGRNNFFGGVAFRRQGARPEGERGSPTKQGCKG